MTRAVIACGSNMNDPHLQLQTAEKRIAETPGVKLLAVSGLYDTKPEGMTEQPDFLNGAFLVETRLTAEEFLAALIRIELEQGRVRTIPQGPRTLDLDLIFFGDEMKKTQDLTLPHPKAHLREFVLRPVNDIAPDWVHPGLKKTVKELLTELSSRPKGLLSEAAL